MILGIGTDMVEIERIRKACEKEAFLTRTYTQAECRQAKGNASMLAGNFAIKEAVAKALGTGFRTFMPIDIEVLRDTLGKPCVTLYGNAEVIAGELGMKRIHASITNTAECALGFVVGEGDE